MRINVASKGDFGSTRSFINRLLRHDFLNDLDRYGQMGVDALSRATPVGETGLSAASWGYRVFTNGRHPRIEWYNTDTVNGTPIVILLQYGHGTGTGGYVQGRDFINPAIRGVFDQIADDVWKKVRA